MGFRNITQEERQKIETLIGYGIKTKEIAALTGRSEQTINRFKRGTYDEYVKNMREWHRQKREQPQEVTQDITIEKPEISLRANDLSYTNTLLNALLMKLTMICEALGVEDRTDYGT